MPTFFTYIVCCLWVHPVDIKEGFSRCAHKCSTIIKTVVFANRTDKGLIFNFVFLRIFHRQIEHPPTTLQYITISSQFKSKIPFPNSKSVMMFSANKKCRKTRRSDIPRHNTGSYPSQATDNPAIAGPTSHVI
jgi:hypothetical protein